VLIAWRVLQAFPAARRSTLAGARAAITWLAEFDDGCIPETIGEYPRTLLRAPLFAA
jgi:hypothetical protein